MKISSGGVQRAIRTRARAAVAALIIRTLQRADIGEIYLISGSTSTASRCRGARRVDQLIRYGFEIWVCACGRRLRQGVDHRDTECRRTS
jgi:hypothetical protein